MTKMWVILEIIVGIEKLWNEYSINDKLLNKLSELDLVIKHMALSIFQN